MAGLWGFNATQTSEIVGSIKDGVFGFLSGIGNPLFAIIFVFIVVMIIIGIFSLVVKAIKARY